MILAWWGIALALADPPPAQDSLFLPEDTARRVLDLRDAPLGTRVQAHSAPTQQGQAYRVPVAGSTSNWAGGAGGDGTPTTADTFHTPGAPRAWTNYPARGALSLSPNHWAF